MDEPVKAGKTDTQFSGKYMTLGMLFGFLWGLLLLGSSWFLAIPIGMAVGALLDRRKSGAQQR